MKTQSSFWIVSRVAVAWTALAWMGLAPSAAAAATGPVFNASTVAQRYNFSFTGRGGDGHTLAMVGWFEVDDAGDVVAAAARGSLAASGLPVSVPMHLDTAVDNTMLVSDATNGIYDLKLRFLSPVLAPTHLSLSVILDDPRGRSGKMSGHYTFFSTDLGGVGPGEIASQ